jgi:CheY-like chemotaxis protein
MDIMMPDMDGIVATAEIRRRLPDVRVVMMSVQGGADYVRRSMLAGASEYLVKPFSAYELSASIRGTLARVAHPAPDLAALEREFPDRHSRERSRSQQFIWTAATPISRFGESPPSEPPAPEGDAETVKPQPAAVGTHAVREALANGADTRHGRSVEISEKKAPDRRGRRGVARALTLGVGFLFVAYVMWNFIHDPACAFSTGCLVPRSELSPPVTDRATSADGSALCSAVRSLGGNREDFQILMSTSSANDAYAALDRMSSRTRGAVTALRAVGTGSVGPVAQELASAEEGLLPILDGFRSMKNEADWAALTADYRRWFEVTQSTTSRLGPRLVQLGVVC